MTISEIKAYMKQHNIRYATLSEKSGIPLTTLKYIFSGKTTHPRIDTMQAIEKALGLSDQAPAPMSPDERQLVDMIMKMTPDEVKALSTYVDFILSQRKN